MQNLRIKLGRLWLFLSLSVVLAGAATPASAGCRLVVKSFNYQALECDSYVPVVNEISTALEIAKRTIKSTQCIQKLTAVATSSAACTGEIYAAGVALWEAYGSLEAAVGVGQIVAAGEDAYVVIEEVGEKANICKEAMKSFARWSEDKSCSGVGQRPQLPEKFRNAKAARVTSEGGLRFLETFDGATKLPYEGRFYNKATDKCDVYSGGRLISSTIWNLCDQFKTGEIFHWSPSTRTCNHIYYGNDLGRAEAYRCGLKYESNEITYKSPSGGCFRSQNGKFTSPLSSSSCSDLTAGQDAYIWKNNYCWIHRNGKSGDIVDKSLCGRNEAVRFEFQVSSTDVGECRRIKDNGIYDLVANSNCNRPSRFIVKGSSYCTLSVDGRYEKLLFNGEEGCVIDGTNGGNPANDPTEGRPYCQSASSDLDGDGWGFEDSGMCKVWEGSSRPLPEVPTTQPLPPAPPPPLTCQSAASDPDGDGWGWENGASCKVAAPSPKPGRGSQAVVVEAPSRVSAYGSFNVVVTSSLQRNVTAELWLKEEGGDWSPYAEQQFTLYPGRNSQSVSIHTFPDASKNYRIELRFLENGESKEIFNQRVSIQY